MGFVGGVRVRSVPLRFKVRVLCYSPTTYLVGVHVLRTDQSPLKVVTFEGREAAAKWLGVPIEILMPQE